MSFITPPASTKSLQRELLESGWHIAICGIFMPGVFNRLGRSPRARNAAPVAMVAGAAWHEGQAIKRIYGARHDATSPTETAAPGAPVRLFDAVVPL